MCETANGGGTITSEWGEVERHGSEAGQLVPAIWSDARLMRRCGKSVRSDRQDISCGRKGITIAGSGSGATLQLVSPSTGSRSLNDSLVVCGVGRR